jgi:hypothetical protein
VVEEHSDFDTSVQRLLETVSGSGASTGVGSDDIAGITGALTRLLVARFPELRDPDDASSEAVARFVEAAQAQRIDARANPAAYLTRIAVNAAIDRLRRDGREELVAEPSALEPATDEEAIVRLLDSQATRQLISEGVDVANQAGDHTVVLIITHWIDMAQRLSRAPTSREIEDRTGVSHSAVLAALARFRGYLPGSTADP